MADNSVTTDLGCWLRERRARGWDLTQMARQLASAANGDRHGLPDGKALIRNIRRWESGQTGVSERYRLLYCAAFGIAPSEFPGSGTDSEPHQPPGLSVSVHTKRSPGAAEPDCVTVEVRIPLEILGTFTAAPDTTACNNAAEHLNAALTQSQPGADTPPSASSAHGSPPQRRHPPARHMRA